jgi:hypothetical protein
MLMEETNRYYHQYLNTLDGCFPLPDITIQEMHLFISYFSDGSQPKTRLQDYWSTLEQSFIAFYGNTMKQDRFFHVIRFLHFSDNRNEGYKNYDRLWKMRTISDKLK